MSLRKKIIFLLLLALVAIQFIRPARNKSGQVLPTDFAKVYPVPQHLQTVFQNACYDCHSNNTVYPWYMDIQPVAWMMAKHIRNGKQKLNFSDFGSYKGRMQSSKLKEIANQVKDDEMPLSSYKWMHKEARLSDEDKKSIIDWIYKTIDSLSSN
jgi:hypothetical protein